MIMISLSTAEAVLRLSFKISLTGTFSISLSTAEAVLRQYFFYSFLGVLISLSTAEAVLRLLLGQVYH